MNDSVAFRRTTAGQAALDRRDKRIPAKLRALMLMAEGKPMAQFGELAQALGAPSDAMEQLVSQGFVVAPAAEPAGAVVVETPAADVFTQFRAASGLMREIGADTMGFKAFFFILKIEKCSTLADLKALVPELIATIARQRGRTNADRIEGQIKSMLG